MRAIQLCNLLIHAFNRRGPDSLRGAWECSWNVDGLVRVQVNAGQGKAPAGRQYLAKGVDPDDLDQWATDEVHDLHRLAFGVSAEEAV